MKKTIQDFILLRECFAPMCKCIVSYIKQTR